jgi:hypothetical protein
MLNPYSDKYTGTILQDVLVIIDNTSGGKPIYEWQQRPINVGYSDVPVKIFPQLSSAYIWHMKIWD